MSAPYWYLGDPTDYRRPRSNTHHWPKGTPGSKGGEFAPGPNGHTPHTGTSVPGDIPAASRPSIEAGANAVLEGRGVTLDFLEVAPTSKRGHRAEGGRFPDGRIGIRISPVVGKSPAVAQRQADAEREQWQRNHDAELARLRERVARNPRMIAVAGPRIEQLEATTRRNTWMVAPDPLRSMTEHEAGHVIEAHYGKRDHSAVWERHTAEVPYLDRLRVSEYAATSTTELWAEVVAALAAGIDIPASLREAYDRTLAELDKQHA